MQMQMPEMQMNGPWTVDPSERNDGAMERTKGAEKLLSFTFPTNIIIQWQENAKIAQK